MKKLFLVGCVLLMTLPVAASHIVGGEFELIHISGNSYRVNLIIYFDKLNGTPGAKDANATISIFRQRDNVLMTTLTLLLTQESNVSYTQPECSQGEIVTTKLTYTATLVLAADRYNDAQGYYMSWQRCCRNYNIDNIFSQNPQTGGISAGQTFYLEFPPVVKDNAAFINSSPQLFPPLNDYACIGRPYYVDFAGVDTDGDSLAYSLITPLNTVLATALPPISPAPYPPVAWRTGYGPDRMVNGSPVSAAFPDLRISPAGLIRVTPRNLGLFVFAVKVEEYRNKEKIGESRRDFQMLVVDCKTAFPPEIKGKTLTAATYSSTADLFVSFDNTTPDAERAIRVQVSDPDASRAEENFTERVNIRVVPLNFKRPSLKELLPAQTSAILVNGSTAEFTIHFPQCPYFEGGPYQIGIIAYDDACSLPLTDTLKVSVSVQPPANQRARFTSPKNTVATLLEGDERQWPFEATDADGDTLIFLALTDGFVLKDAGMEINPLNLEPGRVNGKLNWNAFCNLFDFTNRTQFEVKLLVDDLDVCRLNRPDTAVYRLNVILPGNADPSIDTDLTADPYESEVRGVERAINTTLRFRVRGEDLVDNDLLSLRMRPIDFKLADAGMQFTPAKNKGVVTSDFVWDLRCANLDIKKKDLYQLQFMVVDSTNKCRFRKADTVNVFVKVLPPDNQRPRLSARSLNSTVLRSDNTMEILPGQPIVIDLVATDADVFPEQDELALQLVAANGDEEPQGFEFANKTGKGALNSTFKWTPDCSIFKNEVYENNYTFQFRLQDNRCFNAKKDSLTLSVKVKDVESARDTFLPPNVFTPNGDGFNDYYSMEQFNETLQQRVSILPPDNCVGRFLKIDIYNRWGNTVYTSTDRNFRWYGTDAAPGVYFFTITFSDKRYKGSLSLQN